MKRTKKPSPSNAPSQFRSSGAQSGLTKRLERYTFFRGNKTDQEFTLPFDEIKSKYQDYLKSKPKKKTVAAFVTSKSGLNSSMEMTQFNSLEFALTHGKAT